MKKSFLALMAALLLLTAAGCSSSFKQSVYDRLIGLDRSASGLSQSFVDIGGLRLSYLERPGPGDTLVLVHGFGANKDNWTRFTRSIPPGYRVIALDLPGHGDSDKPLDRVYTADFQAESLGKAIDALKLERVHLVGNSMGGLVSTLYAAKNLQKVRSLCLLDSLGFQKIASNPSDAEKMMITGRNPLIPENREEARDILDYAFYRKPFMPWPVKSVLAGQMIKAAPVNRKMFKDLGTGTLDASPLLPALRMPVLVIWGENDRILDASSAPAIKGRLPTAEVVIIKECGHMPMLEKPKETARFYLDFLGGLKT